MAGKRFITLQQWREATNEQRREWSAAGVMVGVPAKKVPTVSDPAHRDLLTLLGEHFEKAKKNPGRRKVHTAKFDRCVEKVTAASTVAEPYAVCTQALGKKAFRKKNPGHHIYAQKGRGPLLIYNGRSFSNQPDVMPKGFASQAEANKVAVRLLSKFRQLHSYKVWIGAVAPGRRINPSARDQLDVAAKKLEDFTGHRATHVERGRTRSNEKTGLVIGELDLIGYRARRDGKTERYGHHFRTRSRPLLAVSTDGKQLHIVGGQYEFTEAGIEDR